MQDNRCEICSDCDTSGKNVTCKMTGSVVVDICKRNFDCPLNRRETP
jgi:hypothetical protein